MRMSPVMANEVASDVPDVVVEGDAGDVVVAIGLRRSGRNEVEGIQAADLSSTRILSSHVLPTQMSATVAGGACTLAATRLASGCKTIVSQRAPAARPPMAATGNRALGEVFINIPPQLGAVYYPVPTGRFLSISVAPGEVNNVATTGLCPPPVSIPPCPGTANSGCPPPQRQSCVLQCQPYNQQGGFCPWPGLISCVPNPGNIDGQIGCAPFQPSPPAIGCAYPTFIGPSAVVQANAAPPSGRTPSASVSPAQIATGRLASFGFCDPSASSLAPKGQTMCPTDFGFIL